MDVESESDALREGVHGGSMHACLASLAYLDSYALTPTYISYSLLVPKLQCRGLNSQLQFSY